MRKIYILGGAVVGVSLLIMFTALMLSGFDIYDITNYGNFEQKEFNEFLNYDIKLVNCEFVIIDNNEREQATMIYHTNDKVDYEIEVIDNILVIEQTGTDILNSVVPGADKPLKLSIPSRDVNRNIEIVNEKRKNPIIRVEDVILGTLKLDVENSVVVFDDIDILNLEINSYNTDLDLYNFNSDTILIKALAGKLKMNQVHCENINIDITDLSSCNLQLPYVLDDCTLDITLLGTAVCDYVSSGLGKNIISITSTNTKVDMKFI